MANETTVRGRPARWICDSEPSRRYPIWTRGNIGEVFPWPVTPLTWSTGIRQCAEPGWRDALERFGAFGLHEFSPTDNEIVGCFGGYGYLNASVSRILGVRTPGLTPEQIDYSLWGEMPGVPPYEAVDGDEDPARTEAIQATLGWIFSCSALADLDADRAGAADLRAARPDFAPMSDQEMVAWYRSMLPELRRLFTTHLFMTYCATVPLGVIQGVCTAIGDPTLAMTLIGGIGSVDSADPTYAFWELGRTVRASSALTAAFDAGVDGLLERLRSATDADTVAFVTAFDRFLYEFGSRGPNEWETSAPSWETDPRLPLVAIDRMRAAEDDQAPRRQQAAMAAAREAAVPKVLAAVEGDPETHGQLAAALAAAPVFLAGRERTKTTIIRLVNEMRMGSYELGRRMVERGVLDSPTGWTMLDDSEVDAFVEDPDVVGRHDPRARRAVPGAVRPRAPVRVRRLGPAVAHLGRAGRRARAGRRGDGPPGHPGLPRPRHRAGPRGARPRRPRRPRTRRRARGAHHRPGLDAVVRPGVRRRRRGRRAAEPRGDRLPRARHPLRRVRHRGHPADPRRRPRHRGRHRRHGHHPRGGAAMSVVLITGCSTGIGLEAALAFARRGDTVYASMRNLAKADRLRSRAAEEGLAVEVVPLDVVDDASVTAAVADIEARHGAVDVLVNNAGVGFMGSIETIDWDKAQAVMDTNVWGAVRTSRAVLAAMRAKGSGLIVNVTSVAGRVPGNAHMGFYSASKHALGALSEALQWEVAPYGIRVACVEPGFFATEIFANSEMGAVDTTSTYAEDETWVADFYVKSGEAAGGDPAVVAATILGIVDDPGAPLHTLVGDDAVLFVDLVSQAGTYEGWVPVANQIVESVAGPRPVSPKA